MIAMQFKQYDVVKVKALHVEVGKDSDAFNIRIRQPVVGDVATIIEVYSKPPGYELECSDGNGITQWLLAFGQGDIELDLVP
jgi:hypothetical protein